MPNLTVHEAKRCGCADGGPIATTDTVDATTWELKGMKLACFGCGALGPLSEDLDGAVRAWNSMEKAAEYMSQND